MRIKFLQKIWPVYLVISLLLLGGAFYANRDYLLDHTATTKSVTVNVGGTPQAVVKTETAYRPPIWVALVPPFFVFCLGAFGLYQYFDKRRIDREQFVEKAQADRFNDIQNRFADKDDKTRANAALRLAEMGKEMLPGLSASDTSPTFTEANFPYFLRAASSLARALHMEENEAVLDAVKEALETLALLTKEKDADDKLLHKMIAKLYNANITTKKKFIKALAEYKAINPGDSDMDLLESVTRFVREEKATEAVLTSFMATDYYKGKQALFLKIREGCKDDTDTTSLLLQVEKQAIHLITARDALQASLKSLSRPRGAPSDLADAETWEKYKPITQVSLSNAFLAGADLREVYLAKSFLNDCDLQDANLSEARLQCAYAPSMKAQYAMFVGAFCQRIEISSAHFQNAWIMNTWLQGAFCSGTDFEHADMRGAKVAGSFLNAAKNVPLSVGGGDFWFYKDGKKTEKKDKNLISKLDIKCPDYNLSRLLEEPTPEPANENKQASENRAA